MVMSNPSRVARPTGRTVPPEPESVEETGNSFGFLVDLALKTIYFQGAMSGQKVADAMKLPFTNVVDKVLEFVRREQLTGISGSEGYVGERGFVHVVTSKGAERVREALYRSQYTGPAPVPLADYAGVVRAQTIAKLAVEPGLVSEALQHLVLEPKVLDRLGPAINSGRSIFLYGPPGNGKTTIGEAIGRLLAGDIYVPYAVEVEGHVIKIFDPLVHQQAADTGATAAPGARRPDGRWVRCHRPVVMAGGELVLASLDLVYDEINKFYEAPSQVKANGGMFLLDDFGRQQVRPRELLNRWMVPLEKRVDFLTLHTGKKIEMPFDVLIVFATNIAPKELVDEAFLRRIRHKIQVDRPSLDIYRQIMERVCMIRDVPFSEEVFSYLVQQHYLKAGREMSAVHPRDLVDQIVDIAKYKGIRAAMTRELVDEACESYFVKL
jgi:hypothetical protein